MGSSKGHGWKYWAQRGKVAESRHLMERKQAVKGPGSQNCTSVNETSPAPGTYNYAKPNLCEAIRLGREDVECGILL
jgi:hypothetical protein